MQWIVRKELLTERHEDHTADHRVRRRQPMANSVKPCVSWRSRIIMPGRHLGTSQSELLLLGRMILKSAVTKEVTCLKVSRGKRLYSRWIAVLSRTTDHASHHNPCPTYIDTKQEQASDGGNSVNRVCQRGRMKGVTYDQCHREHLLGLWVGQRQECRWIHRYFIKSKTPTFIWLLLMF